VEIKHILQNGLNDLYLIGGKMSNWYDYRVTVFGPPNEIGKFFNIDSSDVNYLDSFDFSFGQKNGPGLCLEKIIKQNSGLVFFISQTIEISNSSLWIERFDSASNEFQRILVETHDGDINKRLLHEYELKFPYLLEQHKNGRPYEWKMFFANAPSKEYLKYTDSFREMVIPVSEEEINFDNGSL
jgi:hypothetical protein